MRGFSVSGGAGYRPVAFVVLLILQLLPSHVAAQEVPVTGHVLDRVSHLPVGDVAVTVGQVQVMTDRDGHFVLPAAPAGAEVVFQRLGYVARTVQIDGGSPLEVLLDPEPVMLSALAVEARQGALLAAGTALAVGQVDRDELTATGGSTVAEGLDGLEGVSMQYTGSWGSRAVLRGLSGERLAVLVDGNRVSRACTFGMDQGLSTIDPATVERVEVLTGPGSALFGSGNLGGVINVVTRRTSGEGFGGEVRMRGSSGVPGGGLGLSLGTDVGSVRLEGSVDGASFGDYRDALGQVDGSSYRQVTADLRADWAPDESQLLSVKGQYYAGRDIGWPMRGGAEIPEESRKSIAADWSLQRGGTLDGVSARAFFQRLDHHMVMSMVMTGMGGMPMTSLTDAVSFSETAGARSQLRFRPGQGIYADVGVEANHLLAEGTRWTERQMGMNPPSELSFRSWPGVRILDVAAFAQGEWAVLPRLTVSAGARMDRVSRTAAQEASTVEWIPTGNAGLRMDLTSSLHLRTSVGTGYRTPDPLELYGLALRPDGFVYRGSADLETERSLNVEATVALERPRFGASVTAFNNRLSDLVVPALAGDSVAGRPVREYRSLGESTLQGVSGSLDLRPGWDLALSATASWTRGEDPETGNALPMIPPLEGSVSVRRDFGGALRWAEVEWTGADRQERVYEPAGEIPTAGWAVTNLRTGFSLAGSQLVVGVENVFDHLYRGHLDPMTLYRPGRNAFVRITRSF